MTKDKMLFIAFLTVVVAINFLSVVSAEDGGLSVQEALSGGGKIPIGDQVAGFYQWALGISGLLALGILVYAGLAYAAAGGNASRQSEAKQWIWNALIGLALLFSSYLILNTINPDLLKFQNLDLSQVKVEKAAEAPQGAKNINLPQLIGDFYQWALGIGGLIALGIIVFGGILYTLSPGNSSRQNDAKTWIFSALFGLVLLFGSYAILYTINPELTRLRFNLTPNKEIGQTSSNQPVQDTQEVSSKLSDVVNKQLGRKSLDSTGLFENWNCGGPGSGNNLYTGFCSLSRRSENCKELKRNGVDCPAPVFVPIFALIQPPAGFMRVPLPTRFLAILPIGFSLPAEGYGDVDVGGNCKLPLNPTLVDNIAKLKQTVRGCTAATRCDVQPTVTACTIAPADNNDGHPIHSHLELRAVDFALNVAAEESRRDEEKEKNRKILEFLGGTSCVDNLIAPSRFGNLCRKNGQPAECLGIKGLGGDEQIIHYDVRSNCKP